MKNGKKEKESPKKASKDKKGKKKFSLFGKKSRKDLPSSDSSSSSSDSSSESDSDESVVKEVREGAQPIDIDASMSAADRSAESTLINPALEESSGAESSIISPLRENNSFGPKIVKTTTKKTFVQDSQGVTESFAQQVEDEQGPVSYESHAQKVVFPLCS